ncbi:hypothetical protein [Clostridium sp. B9]|uniref:hypothetical protein n=1 Tax=Clostridium sp. B9 TaxID=3423224 RepID=UPI003D2EE014
MLLEKLKEDIVDENCAEGLFINFYNNLIRYENENKIILISERIKEYINNLIQEIDYLEEITALETTSISLEGSLKEIKEDLEVVNEKINFIIDEDFEDKTEELLENIILNIKLELIPKIEGYKEDLEISYDYYNKIKLNFINDINEFQNKFLKLIDLNNKKNLEKIKVKINEKAKVILKDKRINIEDIGIEAIEIIKNTILNIDEVNKESFDIYKDIKASTLKVFNEIKENTDITYNEEEEENKEEELIDISVLNKRYIKFIENNSGLIKNKIIKDIQNMLGAESIESKLEIEFIYAQDFIKDEYTKKLNEFCKELKAKANLNVYKKFKSLYGDMLTFQEQIMILDRVNLKIKEFNFINFNDISLIDYLNHSKKKR